MCFQKPRPFRPQTSGSLGEGLLDKGNGVIWPTDFLNLRMEEEIYILRKYKMTNY